MRALTVNVGSSSIRLGLHDKPRTGAASAAPRQHHGDNPGKDAATTLRRFMEKEATTPDVVVHRIVHGGKHLTAPCHLTPAAIARVEAAAPLAPLHNPPALAWIALCRQVFGDGVPQVGVFDTAFFAKLPDVAAHYALPPALCERHDIRRYGFHGIAHAAMWQAWQAVAPRTAGRIISLQLGSGCSVTATRDGTPVDTSMGFSPLEGLMMASRCGDIDAGLVAYLRRHVGLDDDALADLLNHRAGLLGVSGISGDVRALQAADSPAATRALDMFCYRARKYIGAYMAVLQGADALVFGGGVGENAAAVRAQIVQPLGWCGIMLDEGANAATRGVAACISRPDSAVAVWVLPVDEAATLAAAGFGVIAAS